MRRPTVADLERITAARERVCPLPARPFPCGACPTASGTWAALLVLDAAPRDARAARRALHDVVCMSGCTDDDHAARTQSRTVAALRKFHAAEATANPLHPR